MLDSKVTPPQSAMRTVSPFEAEDYDPTKPANISRQEMLAMDIELALVLTALLEAWKRRGFTNHLLLSV